MVNFDYVPVFFYEGVEAVENLYLIEFQNEVDKIVKEYLFNISSLKNHNYFRHEDNENSRKKYYENKGFGLIAEESENTYVINEERFLEGCTRVFLINPIIKMLLDKHGIVNDWKFGNTFANFNVSNREYELGNYLEFIALLNGKRIGVRYTKASYSPEELTVMDRDSAFLFGKNKIPGFEILESIDEVCVLDWSGVKDEELNEIHPDVLGTKPFKKNISVQKFFLDYFSEEEYKVVLMAAKRAVKQAKDIIALRSVPQLLPNNILYFKQSIIEEFAEERMDSLEYQFRECDIAFGLDEEDMQIIKTAFFTLRYRDALIGDSDFAKSFITSEYLFKTVRDGLSIDYTSVVVGYLKSVEQLLFLLYLCAFGNSKKLAYWDKCNRTKEFDISNSEKYRYDPYDESCMQEKYMHRKKTGKNAPVIKDLTRFLRYYEKMNKFLALDTRGNRMYSAGLNNYIRFAEGHDFSVGVEQINAMDIPVQPEKAIIIEQTTWRRSGILRNQALAYANYRCEIDNSHETFIAENTHMPYMEGHHALPMKMQNDFNVSLDVYANIVCLCPVCHRRIHHGLKFDRIDMAKRIFDARGERLENSGIVLSSNEFIERAVNA